MASKRQRCATRRGRYGRSSQRRGVANHQRACNCFMPRRSRCRSVTKTSRALERVRIAAIHLYQPPRRNRRPLISARHRDPSRHCTHHSHSSTTSPTAPPSACTSSTRGAARKIGSIIAYRSHRLELPAQRARSLGAWGATRQLAPRQCGGARVRARQPSAPASARCVAMRSYSLLAAALLAAALFTTASASACMSSALLAAKLSAYGRRASALDIPSDVVECVRRSVYKKRFRRVLVSSRTVACIDEQLLGRVMGKSLVQCMRQALMRTGEPQLRANRLLYSRPVDVSVTERASGGAKAPAKLKLSTTTRPSREPTPRSNVAVPRPRPLKHLTTIARMFYGRRRGLKVASRWACKTNRCNCFCDSGCHFCCSYAGVGIPGSPDRECFEETGCVFAFVRCN